MPRSAKSALFDVVIVGSGPVGAALACALSEHDLKIALLDARAPKPFDPGAEVDLRVFALSPASRRMLESLGAWEAIRNARCAPYQAMHVWDAGGSGSVHFDCSDLGEPALGYIVENGLIQHALLEVLRQRRHVEQLHPARPQALDIGTEAAGLRLDDGREILARLVVAADGAESHTRKLAGINTRGWSYQQRALVAHVTTEKPHRHTAWQRFLPSGPIAFLPLADGRVSVVWSLEEVRAAEIAALDDAGFCAAVTEASAAILGRVTATTARAGFPLQLLHAERYTQPRFALIGDAAHALHPLAGQGVNLGLLDAAALADVVHDALHRQRDIGEASVLRRYERWRKGGNLVMSIALDGFKRLFSNEIVPVRMLRNAGLNAVDRFTPIKSAFMRHAMGLSGDLPPLAR